MQGIKALVVILGMLIILSVGLLGYGFYRKATDPSFKLITKKPAVEKTNPTPPGVFGEVRLPLPEGCSVLEMVPYGPRLFLRTGPAGRCERVVTIDTATGQVLGVFVVQP
jgi:hypothetical protein